jgi:RNA polymerase sigma-70 factor (ECF subfamily)
MSQSPVEILLSGDQAMNFDSTLMERDERTELVCAAQAGDRQAFGRLVELFQPLVFGVVLRRLGDHGEAQEVCQEVFLRALRKLGQLRDPRCLAGWLRSMADRMALNRATRRPPTANVAEALDGLCAEHQTPLSRVLEQESHTQVHVGLGRLSTLDRETLVAFYFDGRSLVEMSDQFHTPVGTIKRRLHVARKRLARELAAMERA